MHETPKNMLENTEAEYGCQSHRECCVRKQWKTYWNGIRAIRKRARIGPKKAAMLAKIVVDERQSSRKRLRKSARAEKNFVSHHSA